MGQEVLLVRKPASGGRCSLVWMVETGISNLGASANNRAQTPTRAGATTESASFRSNGYPGGGRVTAFQGVGAGGASQRDNDRGRVSTQSSNYNRSGGAARGGRGDKANRYGKHRCLRTWLRGAIMMEPGRRQILSSMPRSQHANDRQMLFILFARHFDT